MRDGLRQVWLRDRPWRLVVVGSVLAAAVVVGVFAAYSSSTAPAQPTPSGPITAEPPPQAPASAPEPTLVALANEQPTPIATTEPASPFAGIADVPAPAANRTTVVHHNVAEGEVLWQIAEQYNLRPETILWANDI